MAKAMLVFKANNVVVTKITDRLHFDNFYPNIDNVA